MDESNHTTPPEGLSDAPRYRIRAGDVLQGIGLAAFLTLAGLLATAFRDNLNMLWRQFEQHVQDDNDQHFKLYDRIRDIETKRHR